MNSPYIRALKTLDLAFDYFNNQLCSGDLKKPLINILSRGAKKCLGWYWKDKWQINEETVPEITIVAESLDRGLEQILETLLHEMAHLYNSQANLKDCNAQQRHNKHFKKTATEVFHLQVDKHPTKGWAITSLTDHSRGLIQNFLDTHQVEPFQLVRVSNNKIGNRPTPKTYMISVTEEDFHFIKELGGKMDLSYKEVISLFREHFEEKTENVELSA